ncbi:formate/nitrite transporter family protein [Psychrobacter sp. DAB_AL62B]|uniref:formate/nitrite transporter family protein n=1 Tax=Psychrobacter sp. DAB_AL62B TaxID=1028420 RepID=UPI002380D3BB|nr:formate/nitrite transporter family protein [Psychrobacter sp. DAB_AL62B]MDE4455969.1 formate/nitrite transporter family protein [Psychrobacter sp. DAB_AL62B]
MSQDTEHKNNSQADNVDDKRFTRAATNHDHNAEDGQQRSNDSAHKEDKDNADSDTHATEHLEDEDFSEGISDEDKASIKEVAGDDNLSAPKSYASILVEQVMDAKETFERSLGSLFTSAFTAGLEIGISFFMILSAFALLSGVLPSQYTIVLASLLYPIGFIIVVIGQSLLFTEQTSLLSLPVLNKIQPLHKLLRLWGIVIAGNIVGGCLFAALMIGLGINMQLFTVANIDAYAQHVLDFEWWVIFGSSILAGWMMGVAAWLVTSARDTLSRIVLVTLITGSIGFLGLHHSIVGNIEVFSALMYGNTVSLMSYLWFLVVVLVGNTIGGVVFVAVLKNRTFLFDIEKVKEQAEDEEQDKVARINARRR